MSEMKRTQQAKPETQSKRVDSFTPAENQESVPQPLLAQIFRSLHEPTMQQLTPNVVKQLQQQRGNAFVSRLVQRAQGRDGTAHRAKRSISPARRKVQRQSHPHVMQRRRAMIQTRRRKRAIQRDYAALSPMGKAQVDQKADQAYTDKTQQFEFLMGPFISKDPRAHTAVDVMLTRLKTIVDAWAKATGKSQAQVYGREFGYKTADAYYGAFEMTSANVKKVFDEAQTQPLRAKLKVIYNAVRNSNLAKYLKVAAQQLEQVAKGKKPQSVKIRTSTGNAMQNGKIIKGQTEKETVNSNFAMESGIGSWMSDEQIMEFSKAAKDEHKTAGGRSKRSVFGHDMFSRIFNWSKKTSDAGASRQGSMNRGLGIEDQRTLTAGDMTDLTDEEIKFMYKRKNLPEPNKIEMDRFRNDPTSKIEWEQGGEFYDVIPTSDVYREAGEVKARLEAGISGSTDLMMHAMQNLGLADSMPMMKGMRLALTGWMLSNRDHSFYEIYKAAENYGVPFEIDKNNIGSEYQSDANMFPMQASEFKDLLPEKKFPAYFLSTAYKDTLADTLAEPAKESEEFKKELVKEGVDPLLLNTYGERDIAALSALSKAVATANFPPPSAPIMKKYQTIRRLRENAGFIHLALAKPADAEKLLMALVRKHHGGRGQLPTFGVPQNADNPTKIKILRDNLADGGIGRVLLEYLNLTDLQLLSNLQNIVMQAKKTPPTNQLDRTQINQYAQRECQQAGSKRLKDYLGIFIATLIQTYHGNTVLNPKEVLLGDSARQMAGHEEEGAKKLTTDQLNALSHPTKAGVTEENYWEAEKAKQQIDSNKSIVFGSFLKDIYKTQVERERVLKYFREVKFGGSEEAMSDFMEVIKEEGFPVAVTSFATEKEILDHILPPHARAAYEGAKNLHGKELGAIFQYTGALYKPLVNASNSFSTEDFKTSDLTSRDWGSPLATLQYTGPMLKAISSGLAKLPVYPGKTYRLSESGHQLGQIKDDNERLVEAQKHFRVGGMEIANYPKSAARTLQSQFIGTNYNLPKFDVVYEINNIKSGRSIEFFSDKPNEQEVLFPPGSRMVITQILDHNPDNPADKHIWIRMNEV